MKPIDIPVVADAMSGIARGPGSQPDSPDSEELEYLAMPHDMATYQPVFLPENADSPEVAGAIERLSRLKLALETFEIGTTPEIIDLVGLSAEEKRLIEDVLGEGEVSIRFDGGENAARIQETRLAGVWRVRAQGPHGGIQRDTLEVAEIPALLRRAAFPETDKQINIPPPDQTPEGVLNAPPVLVELLDKADAWQPGTPPHVINLTLLPQSDADLDYLQTNLGTGSATLLSRGYGNCRITATALKPVWWVQYFNSEDSLILNTLEVVEVPSVALAAREDIEDSAERLAEILDTLETIA